jgi:hypothetical protein
VSFFERLLNQTCTYWAPGTYGQYGKTAFSAPVTLACRWEDREDIERDQNGNEFKTRAVVWTDRPVLNSGYLFLGTSSSADPTSVTGAHEIRMFRVIPSVRAAEFERRASLT